MTTAITRRAYWGALIIAFVLVFSTGLFAQSRPTAPTSAPLAAHALNATLAELTRTAPATIQDLDEAQQHGGRLRWVTFWREDKAHNTQMTAALRRNLQFAVPNLIHNAQASGGSISTTFELYKDLTLVCESLDALFPPGSREGNNELTALNHDLSDMNRLREELSLHIQKTAASIDNKNPQLESSANRPVKRIIGDDTIPEKPAPRKRRPSNQ